MVLKENGERLWNTLLVMAKIGPGERGGSQRLVLTAADIEGSNPFHEWATDAGGPSRLDTKGHLFARRAGKIQDAPPVVSGSHLDTKPFGGKI
jgi:N-carbamoyl-L-amino-acid hydrolase